MRCTILISLQKQAQRDSIRSTIRTGTQAISKTKLTLQCQEAASSTCLISRTSTAAMRRRNKEQPSQWLASTREGEATRSAMPCWRRRPPPATRSSTRPRSAPLEARRLLSPAYLCPRYDLRNTPSQTWSLSTSQSSSQQLATLFLERASTTSRVSPTSCQRSDRTKRYSSKTRSNWSGYGMRSNKYIGRRSSTNGAKNMASTWTLKCERHSFRLLGCPNLPLKMRQTSFSRFETNT